MQEQAGTVAQRRRAVFPTLGFLGEKENSLKTDDYGRDLSSVQTLLTKQVSGGPWLVDRESLK